MWSIQDMIDFLEDKGIRAYSNNGTIYVKSSIKSFDAREVNNLMVDKVFPIIPKSVGALIDYECESSGNLSWKKKYIRLSNRTFLRITT